MRILFVSTIYPTPAEPGKGVFNRNLVRALSAWHEVAVLAPVPWTVDRPWRQPVALAPDGSRVLDGVRVHHPRYYYPPKLLASRAGWFYWRSVRATVDRLLRSFRPDVVLGYWAYPDGAAAVRIARETGGRSAVIVGGSDVLIDTRSAARRRRVVEVLRSADAVLSVSDDLRQKAVELGVRPDRSHLWRQGVATDLFRPGDRSVARVRLGIPDADPVVVWVGRMVPVKGLDILVRACGRLKEQGVGFRLYLVGDGPLRRVLEADCRALGVCDRVTFAGPCGHEQLADWYRAADLTVLPSRSEGLPNVLRESVSCGTPFVASRVGGIAEIAEAALDRLVPPEDPAALAEAIAAALAGRAARPQRRYRPLGW
ncbi:MAG TPA: glycosyltransferase, partial [Gemmataceae bacterium]|nr:glycosyltransferase [Gemmataceae bacterium]